uniref:UDENN domain-containing protein n=1 Tax=Arcella intermedia TaxID=1963864 RepID=A0A6B2L921_9EUKA
MTTWRHLPFEASAEFEGIGINRSFIKTISPSQSLQSFSKYKDKWIYIITTESNPFKNTRVQLFSLILFTTEFNPEKYFHLLGIMEDYYKSTNNPVKILQVFLDVLTTTKHEYESNGSKVAFTSAQYNNKNHLLASPLIDVVKAFEINAWYIWSALLMKKRIIVYGDALAPLLKFVRALPLFVLHRQDWSLLRPYVALENEKEVNDLVKTGVYVAGVMTPATKGREDLYDLFIDLTNFDISVASHAEDDFVQTQVHQEFAKILSAALELEGVNDQKLISVIKNKTSELIKKLESLKKESYITIASLQNQDIPANMENFLYSVASAEGMTKIG